MVGIGIEGQQSAMATGIEGQQSAVASGIEGQKSALVFSLMARVIDIHIAQYLWK